MKKNPKSVLVDGTSINRLVLYYVYVEGPWPPDSAQNFYSLCWEIRTGDLWEVKIELRAADFEAVLGDGACVTGVHMFDSVSGLATIQLSTRGPVDSTGMHWDLHSWREWDLSSNREYRFIEISDDIFLSPVDEYSKKCEAEGKRIKKILKERQDKPE